MLRAGFWAALLVTPSTSALAQVGPAAPASAAVEQGTLEHDIPAGPLTNALNQFAQAAGIALSADANLTQGRQSPGLKGRFTARQGLVRLLEGTGITPMELSPGVFGLQQTAAAPAPAATPTAGTRVASGTSAAAGSSATLPTVTIVGNWLANPTTTTVFEHPGARDLVTREQAKTSGATSVREAIARIPGVNAPENNGTGSHDMAMNIGVRGLNPRLSSRSTVLIDGIPLPFAPYGQPQLSFAPVTLGNLETVDVVRGGGAVRYGPQNVGGIINFVTRRIPKDATATLDLNTSLSPGSSQDRLKTTASTLIGGTMDNGLGGAVLYSGTRGSDWREHSKTKIDDLILKGSFRTGAHAFNAMAQRYEGKADMPGGLSVADYRRDAYQSTRPWDRFWGHRNLMTAGYDYKPDPLRQLSVQAFRTQTLRSGYLDQGTFLSLSPRDYTVEGIETRFSQGFLVGETLHEIGVGHRFIREASSERRYREPLSEQQVLPTEASRMDRLTQGSTYANALFIDDRITHGPWTIVPGVRVERIRASLTNQLTGSRDGGDYTAVLPALNAAYAVNDEWNVYANTDSSFGSVQYSRMPGAVTSGGMKPEKGRSYEIGTRFDNNVLQASAGLFLINFNNQYESNQQTNSVYARGKTRHQGLEASAAYDFANLNPALRGLSLYANYAYVDAHIREEGPNKGNQLPFSSKHHLVVGVDYRRDRWSTGLYGAAQSSQFADNENTTAETAAGNNGRIPGYMTWGVHARHALGPTYWNATLGLGVRNLFDKHYFTRSYDDNNSGIYLGQPRTVYLQLSFKL